MLINDLKKSFLDNNISFKSQFIVCFFLISHYFATHNSKIIRIIGIPVRILYKLIIEFIMSIEIPDKLKVGKNFNIYHGIGIVINANCIIGDNISIRQNTTLGSKYDGGPCPKIGNNVDIGCNTVIIGDISIGNNVIIGAGSIVTKSFPDNCIIAGNPAKLIKELN